MLFAAAAQAAEHVIDELDVSPDQRGNVVKLNLAFPMRVMSFQPEKHGDLIHVQVQPIAAPGVDLCALSERQTLLWSADDNVPLVEVSYEPTTLQILDRLGNEACQNGESIDPRAAAAVLRVLGSAEISLRFNRPVWFDVPRGSDPRVLNVLLLGANDGQVEVDTTREVQGEQETPMLEEPANLPLDVPRTEPESATESTSPAPEQTAAEQRYFIALLTSSEPFESASVPGLDSLVGRRFFSTTFTEDGKRLHRLNAGFFADEDSAREVLNRVRIQFPDATVVAASDDDRDAARSFGLHAKQPAPAAESASAAPVDRMAQLVDEARSAIIAKDFSAAVRKLQAVTADSATPYRREAQELLGVAHERALRYEQAAADYRTFLKWYPDGESAARVSQRLAGLMTATQQTRERLRASRQEQRAGFGQASATPQGKAVAEEPRTEYALAGGLSQNWRRENQYNTGVGMRPVTSTLQSNLDLNGRMQGSSYRGRARLDAGYAYDFLANTRFRPRTQFSNVYMELATRDNRRMARIGRQSAGNGGVLGRFDGGIASYGLNQKVKINVVGGLPVESSSNASPDADKYFVGVNTDIGQLWGAWDFNAFYIEQRDYGFLDRRAIGGEARYFKEHISLFSMIDYDVSYDVLNTLLVLGNYMFDNRASINATIDYRKSPYIATTDALQGQGVTTLDDLRRFLPLGEIRSFAEDRIAQSTTLTLGGYYPFNDRFAVNTDVTATHVGSTPASGGIPSVPSTGWEYVYSSQLLVSRFFRENDTAILGAQFAQLSRTDTFSTFVGTRHSLTPQLRFAPTVRYTHSDKSDRTVDWSVIPEVQFDYRWKRNMQFQLEGGVNLSRLGQVGRRASHFNEYFVLTGYRLDF
ncbi:MAG: hypothetical protein IT492_22370 [Gammaproteobacteria bacterium]|nr:hypothetical protein [Gammaproteobacteria bacterium]